MKTFLRIAFTQLLVCLITGAFAQTVTYNQAGTFEWVCPTGITAVTLQLWGGGSQGTYYTAGGGGAFVQTYRIPVTAGQTYQVKVGHGQTNNTYFSADSCASKFGQSGTWFVTANGGHAENGNVGAASGGAASSGGYVTQSYPGGAGAYCYTVNGSFAVGGASSASPCGAGIDALFCQCNDEMQGRVGTCGGGSGGNSIDFDKAYDGGFPGGGGGGGGELAASGYTSGGGGEVILTMLTCITNPVVTNNAASGPGSLRQAIIDACPESTITFDMSTVVSPINTGGVQLTIDKNLTIKGPGDSVLNIHNDQQTYRTGIHRVFAVTAPAVTISGLTISGGYMDAYGGSPIYGAGINNAGGLTISNCTITDNFIYGSTFQYNIGRGAGIFNSGTLTVVNSLFTHNRIGDASLGEDYAPEAFGLAIANVGGNVVIDKCTISQNTDPLYGYNSTIGNVTDLSETVTPSNMTITNSAILDNAWALENQGNLKLINSTVSGNGDASLIVSGGLYQYSGACNVTNCTITSNSTDGITNAGGTLTIANSIVAGNATDYSGGTPGSLGHNIIGIDDPLRWTGPGDQAGSAGSPIDPLLAPRANNGGPTMTYALLAGSPAINAGDNAQAIDGNGSPLTTDQRGTGFPRIDPYMNIVDAGSFESVDPNQVPHASIADKSITEGNIGTSLMKFKVTLDHASGNTIKIKYATADSTATAGSDYVAAAGTVTFKPGTTSKTISITIDGDVTVEPNERFKVKLSKPQNALLLDSLGIGTIKNDDVAAFVSSSTVNESKVAGAESVNVMPNPNKGDFYVDLQLPANKANTTLQLYNNLGVKVWQEDLGIVSGSISKGIYLENKLAAGVYMLMVERNDARHKIKVVISK